MRTRYTIPTLLLLVALLVGGNTAEAQTLRAERTLYISPSVGISNYVGDRDQTPVDFSDFNRENQVPYSLGLEAGYQATTRFAIGGGYNVSNFPTIASYNQVVDGDAYTRRHIASLFLRYTPNADDRIAPFYHAGVFGVSGTTVVEDGQMEDKVGLGPFVGAGVDVAVSPTTSFFVGANVRVSVPDRAADGVIEERVGDGFANFDLLNEVNLGLRYRFRAPGSN